MLLKILAFVLLISVSGVTLLQSLDDATDFTDHTKGSPQVVRHSYFKQAFRLGYKLKLFCEATGYPRPHLTWYHQGVEVDPSHRVTLRFIINGGSVASYLEIDPTTISDRGEYECVANNAKGSHLKKFLTDFQF